MQPLRAQHRVERTAEGENAWRSQALSPAERSVLGALRVPHVVSDLLRSVSLSPGELEGILLRMIRTGWVLIHDPAQATDADVASLPEDLSSPEVDEFELEALLTRHREAREEEAQREEDDRREAAAQAQAASMQAASMQGASTTQAAPLAAPSGANPRQPPVLPAAVPDVIEELPFDHSEAESDGLLEALRHPETAASRTGHNDEWAPPSGGLAALLRALGEPVPEGVEVSPDQEEHLQDLMPVEPWGGSFTPNKPDPEPAERSDGSFRRLRDQPSEGARASSAPQLGAFRQSMSKVQQEQAAADAHRERARQIRQQREDELKKVNQQQAQNRQKEERSREGQTLLGLSAKLAKLKNNRDQD